MYCMYPQDHGADCRSKKNKRMDFKRFLAKKALFPRCAQQWHYKCHQWLSSQEKINLLVMVQEQNITFFERKTFYWTRFIKKNWFFHVTILLWLVPQFKISRMKNILVADRIFSNNRLLRPVPMHQTFSIPVLYIFTFLKTPIPELTILQDKTFRSGD